MNSSDPWRDGVEEDPCCREDQLLPEGGRGLLRMAMDDLPLRSGFTEEVLERIRKAGLFDQTPMP